MMERCPNECRCSIININTPLFVKVSCQGANLTELPSQLPQNTQVLNVSNNRVRNKVLFSARIARVSHATSLHHFVYSQIRSLEPVRSNPDYKHLKQLMASDNEVENMADLIGSPFVKNTPTIINFQYNKMTAVSRCS